MYIDKGLALEEELKLLSATKEGNMARINGGKQRPRRKELIHIFCYM